MARGVYPRTEAHRQQKREAELARRARLAGVVESLPVALDHACPPHHWLIETPHGETCEAQCKRCHATRTYSTTTVDDKWPGAMKVKRLKGGATVSRQARQFRA